MNEAMVGKARVWSYEEICDTCREMVIDMDSKRWVIGDHALLIETKYGQHTMEDFSRDIGMNRSTLSNWKRVSEFYPDSFRRSILDSFPNLTYSHYKDALRCEDLNAAIQWLEQCSAEGWSPDKAAYELSQKIGKPDSSGIPAKIEKIFTRDGMCILEISIGLDDEPTIRQAKKVTIRAK